MFSRVQKVSQFVAVAALIVIAVCEVIQTRSIMSASRDFAVIRAETVEFNNDFRQGKREFREAQVCLVNEAQQFNKTVSGVAEKVPGIGNLFPGTFRETTMRTNDTQLARP